MDTYHPLKTVDLSGYQEILESAGNTLVTLDSPAMLVLTDFSKTRSFTMH